MTSGLGILWHSKLDNVVVTARLVFAAVDVSPVFPCSTQCQKPPVVQPVARGDLLALLPLQVDLVGEGDGGIVVRDLAGSIGVGRSEGDAVVDVEDTVRAAGAPDDGGSRNGVDLGVDLAGSQAPASREGGAGGGGLRRRLGEEVGGEESTGDAGVELDIAVVGRLEDGKGEATGVLETQVDLAVLGPVRHDGAGPNVGLEPIEAKGHNLAVRGDDGGDGSRGAAIARGRGGDDADIVGGWLLGGGLGREGGGRSQEGKEESSEDLHDWGRKRLAE